MPVLCLVFAKPPRAGQVKTRLGATIGGERAAQVAQAMLIDTLSTLELCGLNWVLATPEPRADHGLDATRFSSLRIWDQGSGDLGARVERMLRKGLKESSWVLALGADAPHVPASVYRQATQVPYGAKEARFGRSTDGGFYGLGLSACGQGLLANLPWSHPDTAEATHERLVAHGFTVNDLPTLYDIDEWPDLVRLRRQRPDECPTTLALLSRPDFAALFEEPDDR